jgi:hypothetical protein
VEGRVCVVCVVRVGGRPSGLYKKQVSASGRGRMAFDALESKTSRGGGLGRGLAGLRQGSRKNAERSRAALCQRGVGMCKQANEWRGETRGSNRTLRRRVGEAVTRLLGR